MKDHDGRMEWPGESRSSVKLWLLLFLPFAFCFLPSAFCLSAASPASADIHEIVPPQPFYIAGSPWLLLVAAVCLLAAGAVGWALMQALRQPKRVLVPTAREQAERRLAELRVRLDGTDTRAFAGEVTDILRVFVGAQYGLRAERQTSPEFLESIRGWAFFSVPQHTILQDFLTECDLLKFAREDATREGKFRLIDQAAQFLASEPPTLPAGTAPVTPASARPAVGVPPPLPPMTGTLQGYEAADARYMPPALRQTALVRPETADSSTRT